MAESFKVQALVYHGTSGGSAKSIVAARRIKSGAIGVAGDGLYFWDGSREMAAMWAQERKHTEPSIVTGQLSVDCDRFLDFCCPMQRSERHTLLQELEQRSPSFAALSEDVFKSIGRLPHGGAVNRMGLLVVFLKKIREKSGAKAVLAVRAPVRLTRFAQHRETTPDFGHEFFQMAEQKILQRNRNLGPRDNSILEHVAVMWCVCDYDILAELKASPVTGGVP